MSVSSQSQYFKSYTSLKVITIINKAFSLLFLYEDFSSTGQYQRRARWR